MPMDKPLDRMIYAVTKRGNNLNNDGVDTLTGIYLQRWPDAEGEDVCVMSGPELNNPAVLSAMLKAGNEKDMVVVIWPDELIPCRTGPGPDGIQAVIDILEQDIRENYGQTSWEALSQSIRENREEEA